jgi:GTPase
MSTKCPQCGAIEGSPHTPGCPQLKHKATNKFVDQIRATVDELAVKNLGTSFILIAISNQGQMVITSTNSLPDPLTRINLLAEAIKAESINLQQALHQAAQAETVRLVQESTKQMVKQ